MAGISEFEGTGPTDTGTGSGSGGSGDGIIDPASLAGAAIGSDGFDPAIHLGRDKRNADGSYTRKRGRRGNGAGGGSGTRASASGGDLKSAVSALTETLKVVHLGIANLTAFPEFALNDTEAGALSASVVNVMQAFDIRPDPRAQAVVGLMMTSAMIYGPRFYVLKNRERTKKSDGNVVDFSGVNLAKNA